MQVTDYNITFQYVNKKVHKISCKYLEKMLVNVMLASCS